VKAADADGIARKLAEQADERSKRLEEENARLRRMLGLVQGYHAAAASPPPWMRVGKKKGGGDRATAVCHLSDLHLDEVVDPGQVGGLNAYDRGIAERRLRRWADKVVELGERHRHAWDGAIVPWGGDSVSGAIHDELAETNADYLPGTMVHWAPRIAAALARVADGYGRVHVPCVVGNHGRLTKKKGAKGRGRNSWDWLLCQMVRSHLARDERITWEISEGSYLFVPIYDRCFFLTHGDEVGGGSGWAGVWSPLGTIHRRGLELGATHGVAPAYSVVGHWHQLTLAHHRGLACNGSLKGHDEFAATLRFRPEPAMQGWWAESPTHGTVLAAPVLVVDRKSEGW
jgi:hypothetical protein